MKNSQVSGLIALGALVSFGLGAGLTAAHAQVVMQAPMQAPLQTQALVSPSAIDPAAAQTVAIVKSVSNIKNMSITPDATARSGPFPAPKPTEPQKTVKQVNYSQSNVKNN